MENPDVKFESETEAGRYAPGTKVVFKAEHIADNDDRMVVYANATPLTPDAQGNYAVTLNRNTIIHFDLIKPIAASAKASPWQLTDDGGTVGLLTDVVNVIPGVEFTIRANSVLGGCAHRCQRWHKGIHISDKYDDRCGGFRPEDEYQLLCA